MEQDHPVKFLFRTWSRSSAGVNTPRGFRSADQNRRYLTLAEASENFHKHSQQNSRVPTCFISTTDDPVRALKLAIEKAVNGEDEIHISIIRSRDYHYPAELANECGLRTCLYKTEFLFLWEIEDADIVHVVSLASLVDNRLLDIFKVLDPDYWDDEGEDPLPPQREIREQIKENNKEAWTSGKKDTWPERSGRFVASIAKCFEDGAPHRAIASLIWQHGTHFEPPNYKRDWLDVRVRDAIEKALSRNVRSAWCDEFCGELAGVDEE